MKFRFGSTWLASGGVESAGGIALNGQQINDTVTFYKAIAAVFYARGGRSGALSFNVTRRFNSLRLAQRFCLEHFGSLPEQDDLFVYIGSDADGEWVLFGDVVVDAANCVPNGNTVQVQYSFRVALPQFDEPPPDVVEPDTDMIKRGTTPITDGATSVEVAFSVPFGSTPVVTVSMETPDGGDVIAARVRKGTRTVDGFIADLSAPVPASGYDLAWIASA